MKKKVSDVVAEFLAQKKIHHIFSISGGASLHLIHSINDHKLLTNICCHHEQGCAMAADSYSRTKNHIGVAVATSGPGATNLVTGICGCYYDSIPMIAITGQVSTFRMTGSTKVRQIGFQETPIIDICKPITKYTVQIQDPLTILYELEKCYEIATKGRKGPVLIDIPDNIQRELINTDECARFESTKLSHDVNHKRKKILISQVKESIRLIEMAKRPVIIAGWGLHLSGRVNEVIEIAKILNIPVATTWGASDILSRDDEMYIGNFGTHGERHANFAVQNSDLILSFGARLDTKATGTPANTFAREAKIIMIDIDPEEILKFERHNFKIKIGISEDIKIVEPIFKSVMSNNLKDNRSNEGWFAKIREWKRCFNQFDDEKRSKFNKLINPYKFFDKLGKAACRDESNFYIDTGCSIAWAMQKLSIGKNNRIFHDFNNTAMGWAIPASIGGYFADNSKQIVCIAGDGSFMMSLQELAVIKRHRIPVKIFLVNNQGYSMIKQTQDQWLNSNYIASSYEGGIDFPAYESIAKAFELTYFELADPNDIEETISTIFQMDKAVLCNLLVSEEARVIPQVKAGSPNEEMEPELEANQLIQNMIIKTIQ